MADDIDVPLRNPREDGLPAQEQDDAEVYQRPSVLDIGAVQAVTLGSSTGGTADANTQWYR